MSQKITVSAPNEKDALRLRNAVAKEFPGSIITTSWPGYSITTTPFVCRAFVATLGYSV